MGGKTSFSFLKGGKPGLHLTINPQTPLPPSARTYQRFLQHGIRLDGEQVRSLMKGREQGITQIDSVLEHLLPANTVSNKQRRDLSEKLADALMSKALESHLSREAPTPLQKVHHRDDVLKHMFEQAGPDTRRGPARSLLKQVPLGVSLTIHF